MCIKLGLERSHRGSGCLRGEGAEKQDTIHELHKWITTACLEAYKGIEYPMKRLHLKLYIHMKIRVENISV